MTGKGFFFIRFGYGFFSRGSDPDLVNIEPGSATRRQYAIHLVLSEPKIDIKRFIIRSGYGFFFSRV